MFHLPLTRVLIVARYNFFQSLAIIPIVCFRAFSLNFWKIPLTRDSGVMMHVMDNFATKW
jgi:hypothetical protein